MFLHVEECGGAVPLPLSIRSSTVHTIVSNLVPFGAEPRRSPLALIHPQSSSSSSFPDDDAAPHAEKKKAAFFGIVCAAAMFLRQTNRGRSTARAARSLISESR